MPHPDDRHSDVDLREYIRVVRRRKWTILICFVLVLATALASSYLSTPSYEATAQVLVQPGQAQSSVQPNGSPNGALDQDRLLQDEVQFANSDGVQAKVAKRLGYNPQVGVGQGNADSLTFSSTGPKADRVARSTNTYAEVFIDARREKNFRDYLTTIEAVQKKILDLRRQRSAASPSERFAIDSSVTQLVQTLQTLQLGSKLNQQGNAVITQRAQVPTTPTSPNVERSAILGGLIGLVLGVALAFVFERLDTSIKSKDDLERATRTTVLGLIPQVGGWRDRDRARVVSLEEPSSPAAESYRTLRTSVQFSGIDRDLRSILVTSPRASEGKSTTAANLAVAMARTGARVVVVCCDLRRARLHEFFGLTNTVGFTSVLLGEATLDQAVQWVDRGGLSLGVLTSGPLAPNPSELLASNRAKALLDALAKTFDTVIIDTPPLLPVTDALLLSTEADGVILVATSRTTSQKQAHRAVELLRQVDATILGTVLNSVSSQGTYGYGYAYDYDYSHPLQPSVNGVAGNGKAPAVETGSSPSVGMEEGRLSRRQRRREARQAAEGSLGG